MPNLTDNHTTAPGAVKPSLEWCRAALEKYAPMGNPIVLYDWRSGDTGRYAAMETARVVQKDGARIAIIPLADEYFEELYLSVAPDKYEDFRAGKPIVVQAILLEDREEHSRNRPDDTEEVRDAKTALEVSSFGLLASQTAIELSHNTKAHAITRGEATDRAREKQATAAWQGGSDPHDDGKISRFGGFVDRGRRKVMAFFGVTHAREAAADFTNRTRDQIKAGADTTMIETVIMGMIKTLAGHVARATSREGAMYRWSRNADAKLPVDKADARDIANAHLVRQSAVELMQAAIAGGMNPAEVQGHLLTMRQLFDTGRKAGLLLRGNPMTVTVTDAEEIWTAIQTVRRGDPETDLDACYYHLAGALGEYPKYWIWAEISSRILASGVGEIVPPARDLT